MKRIRRDLTFCGFFAIMGIKKERRAPLVFSMLFSEKGIDNFIYVWYHKDIGATGNGHFLKIWLKITALFGDGRLSFSVYIHD